MKLDILKKLVIFLPLFVFLNTTLFAEEERPTFTYTLDECIHIAMRQSPEILIAAEEINRLKGVVFEEWSSILSVGAGAGYTYREPMSFSGGSASFEQYDYDLTASIPLFSGGKVISGLNIAYLQREISYEQYRLAVSDALYNTKVAFYNILLAKKEIEMRSEELALLAKNVEMTKNKYYDGLVPKYDLMRIEVELANAKPSYIRAENDLATAYETLKKLLGIDLNESIEIEGELAYTQTDVSVDEYLLAAEGSSPELKISRLNESVAKKNVNLATGNFFPTINAFANYDYTTDELGISFDNRDWEFTAGIMIDIPISDILVAAAKKKQAKAQYEQAKISASDTTQTVKLDIKDAYYDLVEARGIIEALEYNVEMAKENLKTAQIRYDNGVGTLLELLDAQLAVTEANINYLDSIFNYTEALARLDKIIGKAPLTGEDDTSGSDL